MTGSLPTPDVLPKGHPAAKLMNASYGAWHLCMSLLACREGATDDLIRECRDGLADAIIHTARPGPGFMETADVWAIFDLIVAEFESDPMSIQCFDSRLVDRAIRLNRDHKQQEPGGQGITDSGS